MIKILHLITSVEEQKGVGGAETLLLAMLKKIDRKQFSFTIAYGPYTPLADEYRRFGADIELFESKSKFGLFAIKKIVNLIVSKKIDIVHAHQPRLDFFSSIAAKITKKPFIFTRHLSISEFPIKHLVMKVYLAADRLITVKLVNRIIAASKAIAEDLISQEKADRSKLEVIYAGLDLRTYSKDIRIGKIKSEFNIATNVPLIGMVGRINAQKAHQYFIRAAAEVLKEVREAKFLIVGDGPLRKEQEDLTKKLGLTSKVIFTGYRKDIPQIMSELDISALSSLSEALAVVNLEAMIVGKPVVCFNVGGVSELVVNGKTGILIPARDYKALAGAIVELIKNKDKAKRMGIEGQKRVKENFTLDIMIRKHEELYKSLI